MPTQRHVLFVDDDPSMLTGLSRLMHPMRGEFHSVFAGSGAAALELLAKSPYDVVVSDLRMPGMDGAQLLHSVQREYPHIIRIVLSGQADQGTALRAVPVAHQFLAKPCDARVLREVISRAVSLHSLLHDQKLKAMVAGIRDLPARPQIYTQLTSLLDRPSSTSGDIAHLVAQDVALCALLLKIVNSSFFGLARRVTAIESAVSYLGTSMLHALMLSSTVTDKLGPRALELGYPLNQKEQQALLCGQLASQLFQDKVQREDAFASGLLHDIGELVLVAEGDSEMLDGIRASEQEHRPLHDIELERASVSHAHVGAYLLGAWGLPYTIVEAVAHHHAPTSVEHNDFDIVDAVYVADLLADYSTHPDEALVARAQKHVERFADSQARLKTLEAAHKQLARTSAPADTTPSAARR